MGKTILIIIVVLLALACGALGLQVLKSAADTQILDKRLADMEARLKEEIASPKSGQPKKSEMLPAEVRPQYSNLDARIGSIETRLDKLEKKTELSADPSATKPGSGASLPDLTKMTPEEREEWGKVIREEMTRQRQKQAKVFKEAMTRNIRSRLDDTADKLSLTPAQKSELDNLFTSQIDKGFEMFMQALQEGDMEKARSEIQKLVEETDEKMKEILDLNQIEKLKELDPDGFGRREQLRLQDQNK